MAVRRWLVPVPTLVLLACCAFATPAHAQRCRDNTNPTLGAAIVSGDQRAVDSLVAAMGTRGATSYLCGYEPGKVEDSDSSTAWCEGAGGTGVGEMLAWLAGGVDGVPYPQEIWAGYGKSESLFRANGRPRRVRVWAVGLEELHDLCGDETCGPVRYERARSLGSIDVELRDVNGWQPLPFPPHRVTFDDDHSPVTLFGIEILSVYPGARYSDTCISGIRTVQQPTRRP